MENIILTFNKLTDIQKILVTVILVIIIYSLSSYTAFATFSKILGKSASLTGSDITSDTPGAIGLEAEDPKEPKTDACPLNGIMHTKKAKDAWVQRRPLAVMIENHQEARPQSGLTAADVVYEAVAEGGITRFMALFYCNLGDIQVGPVRSARTYFLDWLSEYDALYAHVGGANTAGPADALGQIIKYGVKDLNQFSIGFPVFWRDYQRLGHPVATEHTMYSTTVKLWEVGAKRGWAAKPEDNEGLDWSTVGDGTSSTAFKAWKFKDEKPGSGTTTKINVPFWRNQTDYIVDWNYDSATNSYLRVNGGAAHMDLDNNKQMQPKNIVIQFERESNANDGYPGNVHLLYGTIGQGKALFFMDGKVTEGKWIKQSRTARSKYVDNQGKEIEFNKGQIWIQTVPEESVVTY
jgi:hypothetical protein